MRREAVQAELRRTARLEARARRDHGGDGRKGKGMSDPTHGGCVIYECRPSNRVKREQKREKGERRSKMRVGQQKDARANVAAWWHDGEMASEKRR